MKGFPDSRIPPFDNASRLHIRKGKALDLHLHAMGLHHGLVIDFRRTRNDRAVRRDGAGLYIDNVKGVTAVRNFDVSIALAVGSKDLEPYIFLPVGTVVI